ncbi:MAG: response regulator transcription factor [Bacteroidales bacterium]|nr:response regulator transcription factor [Bacteroidales bacterium]
MKKLKAILIDDDSGANKFLADILSKYPVIEIVSSLTDPSKARDTILEYRPDVLFLDIEMPGMNGLELAEIIREEYPRIVIIFVTAFNQYAIDAIKQAAFDYLIKPVDIEEMSQTIDRLLRTQNPMDEWMKNLRNKYDLTSRETEIVQMIWKGLTTDEIAENLFISPLTAKTHRQNILRKCHCKNFFELIEV